MSCTRGLLAAEAEGVRAEGVLALLHLLEQQRRIQQQMQQHLLQQGALLAELAAFRRSAEGLLSQPLLSGNAEDGAPLLACQQEQRLSAPARFFPESAWHQPQQQEAQRPPAIQPEPAAQLAFLLNMIAAGQSRPAPPAPPQQPAPPPAHAASTPLAQLQQLCHNTALLAARPPGEELPVTSNQ